MQDVFGLQDEIARSTVAGLKVKLNGEGEARLARRYTDNVEAYQLYLNGRYHWNKRNGEGLSKAIIYFQKAIDTDPNYALAYAGLADSYILKRIYVLLRPGETLQQLEEKAKAAAEKALQIDETLAEAHTSLGMVKANTGNDEADIEREYKRAIELNPNYATAHHWYALHLNDMGRYDEAIAEIKRALEIDPLSLVINSDVGIVFSSARQYDRSIVHFKKAMEMDPNFPDAHAMLGWTYVRKKMYPEGIAEFEKARALFGSPTSQLDGLIYAYGMSGNKSEALKLLNELNKLTKQHHTQIPWENRLFIQIGLGEHNKAFEIMEKAYRDGLSVKRLLDTPYVDPLRSDPRFQVFQQRLGLAK
jgi:tetratricopeptide (TPR) repeat protein